MKLPCARAAAAVQNCAAMTRREYATLESSRCRRVLIVDDDPDAAALMDHALRAEGHETRVAHSAAEAVELALELRPQVAVIDIALPGMDGFELARALRAKPELDECRFVAVTGFDLPFGRQHEAPIFNAHFVKPVSIRKLQSIVLELDYLEVMGSVSRS